MLRFVALFSLMMSGFTLLWATPAQPSPDSSGVAESAVIYVMRPKLDAQLLIPFRIESSQGDDLRLRAGEVVRLTVVPGEPLQLDMRVPLASWDQLNLAVAPGETRYVLATMRSGGWNAALMVEVTAESFQKECFRSGIDFANLPTEPADPGEDQPGDER